MIVAGSITALAVSTLRPDGLRDRAYVFVSPVSKGHGAPGRVLDMARQLGVITLLRFARTAAIVDARVDLLAMVAVTSTTGALAEADL